MSGLFISFEGIDGSGKSLQSRLLFEQLQLRFSEPGAIYCREPGAVRISEKIRGIILDKDNNEMSGMTEALLYAAARAQTVSQLIRPALAEGKFVVCDRYVDSSYAYQGFARGLGLEAIGSINRYSTGGLMPDVTFLIDIDVKSALERRLGSSTDRIEDEALAFHESVRAAYLELAKLHSDRYHIVNGLGTPDNIHKEIYNILRNTISKMIPVSK